VLSFGLLNRSNLSDQRTDQATWETELALIIDRLSEVIYEPIHAYTTTYSQRDDRQNADRFEFLEHRKGAIEGLNSSSFQTVAGVKIDLCNDWL
jgi:hypothetical protein